MLTLYFIFVGIWAVCAGMTVFTTLQIEVDAGWIWLVGMWTSWAAILITSCLL